MADAGDQFTDPKDVITDQGVFRAVAPASKSIRPVQVLMAFTCGVGGVFLLFYLAHGQLSTVITSRGFSWAAVMFLAGGLGSAYLWLWRANVRLLIGQGQVGYRDIFGRRRFWSRGQIARALDVAVTYTKSTRAQRAVYFLSADGRRALALNTRAWDPDDVRDFIEASGAVLDQRDQPIGAAEARRQFPQAFGWGSQHVMLGTILTMLLAVALVVGGYVLWAAIARG